MAASKVKKSKGQARLSFAQIEVVGQFNDYAWENPKLTLNRLQKSARIESISENPERSQIQNRMQNVFDRERQT